VLVVATVLFILLAMRGQDWSTLGSTLRGRKSGFLVTMAVLAFLANAAGLVATMFSWLALLAAVGEQVPVAAACRIFYLGQLVKYVPGKVLGLVVSIRIGKSIGVSPARMSAAWLLALVISLLTGASVGLLAGPTVFGGSAAWLLLATLPVLGILIRPQLLSSAAVVLARLRRRPVTALELDVASLRRAVIAQLVAWLVGGVHLWFIAMALGAPPAKSLPLCVGAFCLGTVVGVLAVFVPDGIGVREVAVLAALSVTLPVPVAGAVVLISRVVVALSELLTAAIGLLITEALRRRGPVPVLVSE
jgi:hypothetical protein